MATGYSEEYMKLVMLLESGFIVYFESPVKSSLWERIKSIL